MSLSQDFDWRKLANTYKQFGLVLALGAGVSKGAGIPDWLELLVRVAQACGVQNAEDLVHGLRSEGYSLPFIASAVEVLCPPGEDFTEIVRRALYKDFRYNGKKFEESILDDFVIWIRSNSSTLSAVAGLCVVWDQKQGKYVRNPLVHSVVNFNVDSILREYVQARYGDPLLRTIERASKDRYPERISVYHMHGNLRFGPKQGILSKEAPDKLVLTEENYFSFFNSPTSLFNYMFLSLLREHSFLFVGLSMQDDNIRRLLHYSTREREQGLEEEGDRDVKEAIRHFAILKHKTRDLDTVREKTLRRLGTRVLWVDDHAKTPERLGNIYKEAGGNWSKVFEADYV